MEAAHWEAAENGACRCRLCPHHCLIPLNRRGRCQTRWNDRGTLKALTYGACASVALDPIEKKPLAYFHCGAKILSVGSWGCNMVCAFCQNSDISQQEVPTRKLTPEQAVRLAEDLRGQGNIGIAYTYNEPTTFFEFIRDTAPLMRQHYLVNVMVTNGFIEEEPLEEILPYIDAWNIDLKSWSDDFYHTICGAAKAPVLRTIEKAAARSHVEVTHLTVTGENDDPVKFEDLCRWLASIDKNIPLHITRYFPRWHMTHPMTPVTTLKQFREIAGKYLTRVQIGNVDPRELG